jgi:formylmethanofuran dehydrogenase subunit D
MKGGKIRWRTHVHHFLLLLQEEYIVATINVNLISGRSIQQGVAIEGGKEKPLYRTAAGIIELDPSDLKKLEAWKNTNVKVTSEHGSVVVKATETTQGPHPGLAFIPMGPWANQIINPNTYSTGMPTFKGTPVTVEVAMDEKVLLGIELVQKTCGVKIG